MQSDCKLVLQLVQLVQYHTAHCFAAGASNPNPVAIMTAQALAGCWATRCHQWQSGRDACGKAPAPPHMPASNLRRDKEREQAKGKKGN